MHLFVGISPLRRSGANPGRKPSVIGDTKRCTRSRCSLRIRPRRCAAREVDLKRTCAWWYPAMRLRSTVQPASLGQPARVEIMSLASHRAHSHSATGPRVRHARDRAKKRSFYTSIRETMDQSRRLEAAVETPCFASETQMPQLQLLLSRRAEAPRARRSRIRSLPP